MHEAFVNVKDEKISKSAGNDIYLSDITEKGFDPLALRYFFLQAHYSTPVSFTWEALAASAEALKRLQRLAADIGRDSKGGVEGSDERETFIAAMRDDLLTPQALSLLWEAVRSEELTPEQKMGLLVTADAHLGLGLAQADGSKASTLLELPSDVQQLVYERDMARGGGDYAKADDIRYQLQKRGYHVEDSPEGTLLTLDSK